MIKFSKHNLNQKTYKDVINVMKSGWLTHGKFTSLFENELKKFTKAKYCTLVSSCTAALHISCLALGIKKGDEVIVPAMTHTATAHSAEYTGARVKFADIDYKSGNINIQSFKNLINKKTKAIILVHMAGRSCDMKEIVKICKSKNIKIIEDCAHSLGTKYRKKHVGNFGVSGCFSFYPTKQITTGEGGAIITNDIKFYKKIKSLKQFGIDKDITQRKRPGEYDVGYLGFNYRMTDFQAAMGYQQILNYNINLKKRQEIAKRYIKKLNHLNGITLPRFNKNDSYFVFQILIDKKIEKLRLMSILKNSKIGISVHYGKILPEMSYYKKKYNFNSKKFISAKNYADRVISLPVYPKLNNIEIDRITKILKNIFT